MQIGGYNVIEVVKMSKNYGKATVLKNITFHLGEGKTLGILGPNAAGKTTLLKIIATIVKPSSGRVIIKGIDTVKYPSKVRKLISYVPENPSLFEELTAEENILHFSKVNRIRYDIEEFADMLKIPMGKPVRILSKGMKQRVSLAIALLKKPKVLLLDEPTSGLDRESSEIIWKVLKNLKKSGVTMMISSHSEEDIFRMCDDILVIDEGETIYFGNLENFWKNFENLVEIEIEGDTNSEEVIWRKEKTVSIIVNINKLEEIFKKYKVIHIRSLGIRENMLRWRKL